MPKYLDVTFHYGPKIDYTDHSTFYRVGTQQILQQIQQQNKVKRKTQKSESDDDHKLNISAPQMQLSQKYYIIPQIVKKCGKSLHKVNLWVYYGDRETDWHYDGHDNILYVLQGKKIIYLARPQALTPRNVFSLFNNHQQASSQVEKEQQYRVEVTNGSCVYIPKGWWHRVLSQGEPNVAVNFWFNSVKLEGYSEVEKTLLLKNLLFELTETKSKEKIQGWENFDQEQKQQLRKAIFVKLISQNNLSFSPTTY